MKNSLEITRAKNSSDVIRAREMLVELVRKYEKQRNKKYENDLKTQMFSNILPKPIQQQLVLEDGDGSATHESVERRATIG